MERRVGKLLSKDCHHPAWMCEKDDKKLWFCMSDRARSHQAILPPHILLSGTQLALGLTSVNTINIMNLIYDSIQ